jgi:hypothetical protein
MAPHLRASLVHHGDAHSTAYEMARQTDASAQGVMGEEVLSHWEVLSSEFWVLS